MKYLFALLLLGLFSCATCKNSKNTEGEIIKRFTVSGNILAHHGYCGGARPTPEQERGYDKPMPVEEYIVRDSIGKKVATFRGDNASYSIDLPPGTYSFYNAEKELSLEKFKELNGLEGGETVNKKLRNDDCFLRWQKQPDLVVTLIDKNIEKNIIYRSRCFTGTNPCIQYTGPYPP